MEIASPSRNRDRNNHRCKFLNTQGFVCTYLSKHLLLKAKDSHTLTHAYMYIHIYTQSPDVENTLIPAQLAHI